MSRLVTSTPRLRAILSLAKSIVHIADEAIKFGSFSLDNKSNIENLYSPVIRSSLIHYITDSAELNSAINAIFTFIEAAANANLTEDKGSIECISLHGEILINPGNRVAVLGGIYLIICHGYFRDRIYDITAIKDLSKNDLRCSIIVEGYIEFLNLFGFQEELNNVTNLTDAIEKALTDSHHTSSISERQCRVVMNEIYWSIHAEEAYKALLMLHQKGVINTR